MAYKTILIGLYWSWIGLSIQFEKWIWIDNHKFSKDLEWIDNPKKWIDNPKKWIEQYTETTSKSSTEMNLLV
jgi:hypothetical protein